jgi:hypothetical protein
MLRPTNPPWLDHSNSTCQRVKVIRSFSLCSFLKPTCNTCTVSFLWHRF